MQKSPIFDPAMHMRLKSLMVIMAGMLYSCSSYNGPPRFRDTEVVTMKEARHGVLVSIKEAGDDEYLITDEALVMDKDKSAVFVAYLDGRRDTILLRAVKEGKRLSLPLQTVLFASLASSYFNKGVMKPADLHSYMYSTVNAYNNSSDLCDAMYDSGFSVKTGLPGKRSKGYEHGRHFRSF